MLKIDEKYAKKFFPNLTPKFETISPFKTFRLYMYENNMFMCVETKLSNGEMIKIMNTAIKYSNAKYEYEKHSFNKHNVYVCKCI